MFQNNDKVLVNMASASSQCGSRNETSRHGEIFDVKLRRIRFRQVIDCRCPLQNIGHYSGIINNVFNKQKKILKVQPFQDVIYV